MVDVKLPHLEKILDVEQVLQKFKSAFAAYLSAQKLAPKRCVIERIQHKRGKRCRVLYRIILANENGETCEHWFLGKMVKQGQASGQFEAARLSDELSNGTWPAVSLWEDWDMLLWAFPNDPAMRTLRIAADPNFIRSFLSENIDKFGYDLNWRCVEAIVKQVKCKPGKRCVLRVRAVLQSKKGEREHVTFYSKTYPDGNALAHYRALNQVHQHFSENLNIPRPILFIDQANTFWQAEWPGQPLVDMLQFANWDALFSHLGEKIAQFHTMPFRDFAEKHNITTVSREAIENAKMLGWLLPARREHMEDVLDTILQVQQSLPMQYIPKVPIHGALRLEQFLANGNEVSLVDFDATSSGDPIFDVATFIASLQYMELTHGFSRQVVMRAINRFQENYFRLVPWEHNRKRLAWYATSFFLAKMYDSVKTLDRKALDHFDRALEMQSGWLNILQHKKTSIRRPAPRLAFAAK